jgi:hypothetical protein
MPGTVSQAMTDAVTQSNVKVVGGEPSIAMGNIYYNTEDNYNSDEQANDSAESDTETPDNNGMIGMEFSGIHAVSVSENDFLTLRDEPTDDSGTVIQLKKGEQVYVEQVLDGWAYLTVTVEGQLYDGFAIYEHQRRRNSRIQGDYNEY